MPQTPRTVKTMLGGLAGLVGLSVVAGVLVTATVTPALAVSGFAANRSIELFNDLPSFLEIDRPMEPSTIYYTNEEGKNVKLATFYDQNRIPVTYEQVAPVMYDALLSSEDKHFYEHGGIDLLGTTKALIDNIVGDSTRGGSSISQQYVKNVLMQRCESEIKLSDEEYDSKMEACFKAAAGSNGTDGLVRKLQEMRYAIQIEKEYSKNQILIGYLNLANFGGRTYGIEAAAQHYFNTTAAKLTVDQAAILTGMVQSPNSYRIDDPTGSFYNEDTGEWSNSEEDGYADTLARRNYVLGRLLEDKKITQEQYDEAYAKPITPDIVDPPTGCAPAKRNAYFCQYVKSELESDPIFGETQEERDETLRRGGLEIYTSLDASVQQAAVASMAENVDTWVDGIDLGAAAVSIDNRTGNILAMVQNTAFSEDPNVASRPGYSAQVYAADAAHGSSIGFSVGSTYKVFTLVDWLEKGKSLNEGVNGVNRKFEGFKSQGNFVPFDTDRVGNAGGVPGYVGTPMQFTASSLNSGFLAMATQLDLYDINSVATRMGVHLGDGTPTTDENVPFASVLGNKAIAPLQMASAYGTIANNGKFCEPRAITKVIDAEGAELPIPDVNCKQVIDKGVAATAAYALEGVMTNGTGTGANPYDGVPVLGKTGTHEDTQTMMIEASTNVTTSVWVGQASGDAAMSEFSVKGGWLPDIRYYLARDVQRAANDKFGGDAFPEPESNLLRQVYADLPSVIGQSIEEATRILTAAGFSVTVGAPVDSDTPKGMVAQQSPGAGSVASGTSVTISPSTGKSKPKPYDELPDVVGEQLQSAIERLQKRGYTNVSAGICQPDPAGGSSPEVIRMNPSARSKIPLESPISLDYRQATCEP